MSAQSVSDVRRILFLERNVDGTVGGSHGVLLEVIRHLDRTRFEPTVLFYQDNVLVPEFRRLARVMIFRPGGTVISERWPWLHQRFGSQPPIWSMLLRLQKVYNFIRHALPWHLRIAYVLLRYRFDLVCCNNAPFHPDWLWACGLLNRRCVSYFRGTPHLPAEISSTFPRYDAILSISEAVTTNARLQGGDVDNFVLVYDGIDVAAVRGRVTSKVAAVRAEFVPQGNRPLIGVVNNIKEWKGQHVAVEAVALLKERGIDVKCLLVGDLAESDRSYFDRVMRLIHERGIESNVVWTGRRSDVPDILMALDLVLHTSTSNEGFPRIILETLTLGRPLVASSSGPNVEMIEDGVSGFLVPADDPAALADRIAGVLPQADLLRSVGERASERAERLFNIEINMKKTEDLFERVLAKQPLA